ncbi:MAG: hypothetical protein R3E98_08685 [Gemmatimonadota bacterium]
MKRIPALLVALFLAGVLPLGGQLVVQGVRDLAFGPVLQGIAGDVLPTDPIRSGQFYFRTPSIGTRIRIRFNLPNRLNGPGGARMNISFANDDAMAQGTAASSPAVLFNPRATSSFVMTTSRDANVWLGGRVTPAANQPVGTYTNTVVMTVTIF